MLHLRSEASPRSVASTIKAYWGLPKIEKHEGKFNHGVVLMPRLTTVQLQNALKGDMDPTEMRAFLGTDDPIRWKYVYFSEPDLILHTVSGSV